MALWEEIQCPGVWFWLLWAVIHGRCWPGGNDEVNTVCQWQVWCIDLEWASVSGSTFLVVFWISCVDNHTHSPGWNCEALLLCWSAKHLLLVATCVRPWWACSQTSSLHLNQLSTAGELEGAAFQGKNGVWKPKTHWKGVSWVAECVSEFCAYSDRGGNETNLFDFWSRMYVGTFPSLD